jgi:hypothetical protein
LSYFCTFPNKNILKFVRMELRQPVPVLTINAALASLVIKAFVAQIHRKRPDAWMG